jgi:hypothetical protein
MYGSVDMGFVQESGGPTGPTSAGTAKGAINKLTSGAQSALV